eukprot:Nk52_evm1s2468 gene=Nk52_evmTU1s2468
MLVTIALFQVTEVNGNVIGDIVDIEDTTETKNIDIVQGGPVLVDECKNICVGDFKGKFEDSRKAKKGRSVLCKDTQRVVSLPWWCAMCSLQEHRYIFAQEFVRETLNLTLKAVKCYD